MMKKSWVTLLSAVTLLICSSVWAWAEALEDKEPVEEKPSPVHVTHGISMFGDLKYPKDFAHFEYANPNAPKQGKINYGAVGSFNSLNPYILKGNAADGLGLTYDTLLSSAADEAFSEYGRLAETVEMPEDRSWVIFNLRKAARWHDNTPITAGDVVFSFSTLKTKGHPFYRNYYNAIEKAEALSDYRVKFTFATSNNRELPLVIGQLPILPKTYWEHHNFEETTLTPPLASGPYKIKTVDTGKSITYERVEDYWGKDLPVNVGHNNFDEVEYEYYRDATVAVEAFKAGEYDLRQENISKVWATSYNIPAVTDGRIIKEEIDHKRPTGMQGYVFNTRREKFKDPRVREAINYALDFEWTNEKIFYGAYTRSTSYFSNSEFAASGLPDNEELALLEPWRGQIPERVFTTSFIVPTTDGSGNNRENLLKAKMLLEKAGWVIENKTRVNKDTKKPLTIEFLLSSPAFERVTAPFIKNLKRLGINASIRIIDSAQYQKRLQEFDFDMSVYVFPQSLSPGNEQMNFWHSSVVNTPGSQNLAGVNDPAVDAVLAHLVSANNKVELLTAAHALDRLLLYGYYVVPNWHIHHFRVIYWNKFDRPKIQPKYVLSLDTWWAKD